MENNIECREDNRKEASPTAGIIVIGDEILKGHVQDTNSHFLCQELWKLGVKVTKSHVARPSLFCYSRSVSPDPSFMRSGRGRVWPHETNLKPDKYALRYDRKCNGKIIHFTISVIGDDLRAIANEVRLFSGTNDFVLTSGGVGPTHDDVTMEAIGLAFNEQMVRHPDMMKRLFGDKTPSHDNAWIKMAITPKSTTVINGVLNENSFVCPLMVVRNVYPFPGVPSGLKDTFIANKHLFSKSTGVFYLKEVFFTISEDQLAAPLRELQEEFKGSLDIGSYPTDGTLELYSDKVTIEGRNKQTVEKCYCRLLLMVGCDPIQRVNSSYKESPEDETVRRSISWLFGYMDTDKQLAMPLELCQRLKYTLDTIEETLRRFSFDEICVAFNGGKDCTVIMHVFHAFMEKRRRNHPTTIANGAVKKIKALYVAANEPFEEVEDFISDCVSRYNLDLIRVNGSIQFALSRLKESHPTIKAILMGTRYSDPFSDTLCTFSPTDPSWPQYLRVHAILKWSYHNVWLFLRMFGVQYCPLYDKGYTSLGNTTNTVPNSSLHRMAATDATPPKSEGACYYQPAYLLKDEELERAGRNQKLMIKL